MCSGVFFYFPSSPESTEECKLFKLLRMNFTEMMAGLRHTKIDYGVLMHI